MLGHGRYLRISGYLMAMTPNQNNDEYGRTRDLIRRTQEVRGLPITDVDLATLTLVDHVTQQLLDETLDSLKSAMAVLSWTGPRQGAEMARLLLGTQGDAGRKEQ